MILDNFVPEGDQIGAAKLIKRWWKVRNKQCFSMGGYAGTGKSTLIAYIIHLIKQDYKATKKIPAGIPVEQHQYYTQFQVKYITFTGKAAMVLQRKGLDAQTIHSLIYKAQPMIIKETLPNGTEVEKEVMKFSRRSRMELGHIDLIVIDEASMVSKRLYTDIMKLGIPVLAIGDHGQLAPVGCNFNLMENTDTYLEKIHRQAEGDPILKLATMARQGRFIPFKTFGAHCLKTDWDHVNWDHLAKVSQVICGRNDTRRELNEGIREHLGYEDPLPVKGDKLICLKNNFDEGFVNGMMGVADRAHTFDQHTGLYRLDWQDELGNGRYDIKSDATKIITELDGMVPKRGLAEAEQFDFGYAVTCHKAQGSQYPSVVLVDEPLGDAKDRNRWRYTGITRAEHTLIMVA
jgi:exodeoxyribonuclease-5